MSAPKRWRVALVLAAVFGAGAATGVAVPRLLGPPHHHPHGPPPWLRELHLSDAQRTDADAIFQKHRADVDAIMRDVFPRVRARGEQMEQELRAILTAEQRAEFDTIRAHRPRHPPHDGPPGPPPPPFGEPPPGPPPPPPGGPAD